MLILIRWIRVFFRLSLNQSLLYYKFFYETISINTQWGLYPAKCLLQGSQERPSTLLATKFQESLTKGNDVSKDCILKTWSTLNLRCCRLSACNSSHYRFHWKRQCRITKDKNVSFQPLTCLCSLDLSLPRFLTLISAGRSYMFYSS